MSDKEVSKYAYKENLQFNEHLIGSDVQALRMAMVLMGEGEPIETLKELYNKIHLYFVMGLPRTWESILKYLPSLRERYERSHPQKKISERLFGKENEEYERFVQSVRIKSIDRIPENTNKNTFDYIHVEVRLSGTIPQETRLYLCKKYARVIGQHVLIVIEESPRFQKFGVPSNILKLEKATLGRDATLYMTMGIKERQCWS